MTAQEIIKDLKDVMLKLCPHYGEEGYVYESCFTDNSDRVALIEFYNDKAINVVTSDRDVVNVFDELNAFLENLD